MDQRTRLFIAVLTALVMQSGDVAAEPLWKREYAPNAAGREAYGQGNFDESLQRFESLDENLSEEDKRRTAFNRGAALYRLQRFKEAEREFDRAAASNDPELRADALYNRGLAQEGAQAHDKAIESYRKALLTNPAHDPARVNLEKLLREPPPQDQQQQQQQQSQEQKEQQQQEQQNQAQQGQEEKEQQQEQAQAEQQEDPQQDRQQQRQGQSGEEQKDEKKGGGRGRELTQKEADDILRSAEQETKGGRLMHSGKPPRDYDPSRDW